VNAMPPERVGPIQRRRLGLRAHLIGLILAVLLPALGLGAVTAWHMAQNYRDAFEHRLLDTARALALAVDREIVAATEVAAALASSPLLARGELPAWRAWASEVSARLGGWVVVNEAAPGYQQVLNTRMPEGAPLPPPSRPGEGAWSLVERVVETGKPAVSNLFQGRATNLRVTAVAAPVLDGAGRVERVVVLVVDPARLSRLLADQHLAGGALAGLADGAGRIIARSRDAEAFVGVPAPEWYSGTTGLEEGLFSGRTADGTAALFGFHRIASAPSWGVIVAEPLAAYRASWRTPLLAMMVGAALAFALGLALAWAFARRVLRPISSLVQRAEAVAMTGTIPSGPQPAAKVAEFETLRVAAERAALALQASEAEFRAAFEQSSVPMSQVDCANGELLRVNAAYCTLLGRPAGELEGRPFSDFVHPEDREADLEGFHRMCRGEATGHHLRKRYLRPDGTVRWAELSASPVRDTAGRVRRTVAVVTDVTERHQTVEALRQSEERLRLAQEAAAIGIYDWDVQAGRIRWTPEMYRLNGIDPATPPERLYEAWLDRLHPDDRERAHAETSTFLEREGPLQIEFRVLLPDGGVRWVLGRGSVERDAVGRPIRMMGVNLDVTELREAERALRESEEIQRLSMGAGRVGAFRRDLRTGLVRCSAETRILHGVPPGEGLISLEDWVAALLPEDRKRVLGELSAAVAARVPERAYDYRIRALEDGSVRHIETRTSYQYDAAGHPVAAIGVLIDVTERKRAEEQRELLMREVDHRAKNALAVVEAALRLTPKDDPKTYCAAVEGRVRALARAHTLLAQDHWRGADLRTLLLGELEPFLGRSGADSEASGVALPRAELIGPKVGLPAGATQALTIAMHELATNAVKYGALSVPNGKLTISWHVEHGEERRLLRLRWAESGGPAIAGEPGRRGFGTRVLDGTIRRQLGGALSLDWQPGGLVCELQVPIHEAHGLNGESSEATSPGQVSVQSAST
jgi:PAS domain S-box-containing protein